MSQFMDCEGIGGFLGHFRRALETLKPRRQ
jgi:hypothetical protein